MLCLLSSSAALVLALPSLAPPGGQAEPDARDIRTGHTIPDEGYCDQPYVVVTKQGHWLCTMTTGPGREGQKGQHVVSTRSTDQGRTWSPLVDIEPSSGPEASWAMPLVTPGGRVYVFYDYNGERVDTLGERTGIRADILGWYVYKYSDDDGRTWSDRRYRLPVRETEYDRDNDWAGKVQMFWGIGKPIIVEQRVYLGFSKIGKHVVNKTEGWFFRSDNLLTEPEPARHEWVMLPDGDVGLRSPEGSIAEEHNLVALSDGSLYTMYRTVAGYACHAYSRDGGHTWTPPAHATYTPGGRRMKNPRACPRVWKTSDGRYLFWYHNHGGRDFKDRNPVWLAGGIERDGHIHWSQPEIVLYDPDPEVRISYPDLIEQDGRYWITETQKTIARVHEIDAELIRGLHTQGRVKQIARKGLVLSANPETLERDAIRMPKLPSLRVGGGFTIEMRLRMDNDIRPSTVLDARDERGQGVAVSLTDKGSIRIDLNDGEHAAEWSSDPGLLKSGALHHIVAIVDGGPKIITFVMDGVLCDGGDARQYGWGRFPPELDDVNGSPRLRLAGPWKDAVRTLRVYDRYLTTSEAVGNFNAGSTAD